MVIIKNYAEVRRHGSMEEETEEGDASRKAGTTATEWPTLPPCSTPEEDGTVAMPTPTPPSPL
jgi:hypothetical protein